MSMSLAVRVWRLNLDKTTTLILMALCDSADDDGTHCHASEDYLMWKTSVSRATLYRVLNALTEKAIISRQLYTDGTVETIINLDNAPQKAPWKRPKRGGRRAKQPDTSLTTRPFESHHETLSVSQRDPLNLTARPFESHGETDNNRTRPEPVSDGEAKNVPIHPSTHPTNPTYLTSSLAPQAPVSIPRVQAPAAREGELKALEDTALRRDPLIVTLIACFGVEPATRHEWDSWRIAVNDLHAAGVTSNDIPRAIKGYQALHPNGRVTPMALARNWSQIREGKSHDLAQLEISRRSTQAAHDADAERERADAERRAQEKREVELLLAEYGYADGR